MTKTRLLPTLLLATLPSLARTAESLAEQEYWASQTGYIQRTLDRITEDCGKAPAFAFDRPTWWPDHEELRERSITPNGRCEAVVEAVWTLCRESDAGREAVAARISHITCGYGGTDSGFRLGLSSEGELTYDVEENRPNVGEEIVAYLQSRL